MTMIVSCVFLFKVIIVAVLLLFLSVLSINCNKSSVGGCNRLTLTAIQRMHVAPNEKDDEYDSIVGTNNNSNSNKPFIISFFHPNNDTTQYEKNKCSKQLHTIQNSIVETYINELLLMSNTTSTTTTTNRGDTAATTTTPTAITSKQAYEIVLDSIDLTLRRNQIHAATTIDTKSTPVTRHRQLQNCKPWICLHQNMYCNGNDSKMSNPCCLLPSCNFLLTNDQSHFGLDNEKVTHDLTIFSKVQKDETTIDHDEKLMIVNPVVFTSSNTSTIQRIRKRRDQQLHKQHQHRQLLSLQQQSEQQKQVHCTRTICKQETVDRLVDMGCCTYCGLKGCSNVTSTMNNTVTTGSIYKEDTIVVATNKSISDSVVVTSNITTQLQKQRQALRVIVGNKESIGQLEEEEQQKQLQKNGSRSSGGFQTVSEFYNNIDKLLQNTDPCVDYLKGLSYEIIYFS